MADLSAIARLGYGRSPIMPVVSVLFPNEGILGESVRISRTLTVVATVSGWMPVAFGWAAVGGADSYQLEIGTTSGASDYAVLNVGAVLTYTAYLPPGTYYARVKAVTGGTPGTASAEQGPFYV